MKKMLLVLVMIFALSGNALALEPPFGPATTADAVAIAGASIETHSTVIDPRELPGAIAVIPMPIPLIQGGRVGDVTAQMVKFAIPATPYGNGDKVVRILKVVKGSIFDRVRLEDIELDLIEAFKGIVAKYGSKDFNLAKVRYIVQYKDSAVGAGIGGGGAGSISGLNGGSAAYGGTGSLAVLPGYTRSTADPMYIIKFFEVQ
jgi:hypothetical protein